MALKMGTAICRPTRNFRLSLPNKVTPAVLDEEVRRLIEARDYAGLRLGILLARVKADEAWRSLKFKSWDEYLLNRFDRKRRWADLQIRLAGKLVDLPRLREAYPTLGPSKARVIAEVATPETEEDWIAIAEVNSVRGLQVAVDGSRRGESSGPPAEPAEEVSMTMSFVLYPGQHKTVKLALDMASRAAESSKPGHLLSLMAADFLAGIDSDDLSEMARSRLRLRLSEAIKRLGS